MFIIQQIIMVLLKKKNFKNYIIIWILYMFHSFIEDEILIVMDIKIFVIVIIANKKIKNK